MEQYDIKVHNNGKIYGWIKKLNGGNLAPKMSANRRPFVDFSADFAALNMPLTRLHDTPLENPAMRLVDVPMVFPLFHADPQDSRNYYFRQTDDYIQNCLDCGTKVMYRLGVSIEHGKKRYFVDPPEDCDKWADICINVIRHCNEGLWNGHYFGIEYWEIWNEPGNNDSDGLPKMWGGTIDEFNEFYCRVSRKIKQRFPHLKIGGPSHGLGNDDPAGATAGFLKKCADAAAPLDFYSWHCYSDSIVHYREQVAPIRRILDEYGFQQTELHLNEWHYFPVDWELYQTDIAYKRWFHEEGLKGLDAAAFIVAVQIAWQDTPLDMGGYYTATSTSYGLFTPDSQPTPSYYGMKAFGEIVRYPRRLKTEAPEPVYALAGEAENGKKALLISAFQTGKCQMAVDFDVAPSEMEIFLLDDRKTLAAVSPVWENGYTILEHTSSSAVFLVYFK